MASFVWGRHPQEAYRNPYEHEANQQFSEEATRIVEKMLAILMEKNMFFPKLDRSLGKAEWMLLTDALDALKESIVLLDEKRHRLASRLFRDIVESIDLVEFFQSESAKSKSCLSKWFDGEFIPHRTSREFILQLEGEEARKKRAKYYQELSGFTHRTYGSLCDSYVLGRGELMVHDLHSASRLLVLPQTTSAYYAVISDLIINVSQVLATSSLASKEFIKECWAEIIEFPSVPRRFYQ